MLSLCSGLSHPYNKRRYSGEYIFSVAICKPHDPNVLFSAFSVVLYINQKSYFYLDSFCEKNGHILPTGQWYAPSAVTNDALIMPEDARACQSMPEYARVCQSMPEYARGCQSMPEYARVCQSKP